jgi:Zn-dependent protease
MRNVLSLGKLFGIRFQLHFSWFIIFVFLTLVLVEPNYSRWSYWVIGVVTSLLLFASVLAHEVAHSLVGRVNGIPVDSITLFIFGGVAHMTEEVKRPGAEMKMAIAGPLCSLIIGILLGLLWFFMQGLPEPVSIMVWWLAIMNLALAGFNLIPGFPMDGGRLLRSLLWRLTGDYLHSTRIAARIGQGIGLLLILSGILLAILRPFGMTWFDGIWIAFIGWFLGSAASASYRQISHQEAMKVTTQVSTDSLTRSDNNK